jgi:polysaccharide pyruvyl transferase WcaK-like protein
MGGAMEAFLYNSVAANGGDELLVRVLHSALYRYSNIRIVGASTNSLTSFPFLPFKYKFLNDTIAGDAPTVNTYSNRMIHFSKKYFPLVYKKLLLFLDREYRLFFKIIKSVDVIILCPGGYIHDYYDLSQIAKITDEFVESKKKIIIFGQSVGPFKDDEAKTYAKKIFNNSEKIVLREKTSARYIREIDSGLESKISIYTDIAFLYNKLNKKKQFNETFCENKVFLNFREWGDESIKEKIIRLGVSISECFIQNGMEIEFISTCQGVEGYRNDSEIAYRIIERSKVLTNSVNVLVHEKRYSIEEFMEILAVGKYYVGMRMHAAIMGILSNVPSFNLGYEPKSDGVFQTIGLEEYACNVMNEESAIMEKLKKFMNFDYAALKEQFGKGLEAAETLSKAAFDEIR